MRNSTLLLILISFIFYSCDKDENFIMLDELDQYVVFGEVYGACYECNGTFLLYDGEIYEPIYDDDQRNLMLYNPTPLSSDVYDMASPLLSYPSHIFGIENTVIVQTIADYDRYLKIKIDNREMELRYDSLMNLDQEIEAYINSVEEIYNLIKD